MLYPVSQFVAKKNNTDGVSITQSTLFGFCSSYNSVLFGNTRLIVVGGKYVIVRF